MFPHLSLPRPGCLTARVISGKGGSFFSSVVMGRPVVDVILTDGPLFLWRNLGRPQTRRKYLNTSFPLERLRTFELQATLIIYEEDVQMVIIFFLLFFIPVCFAEDSGWNVAVETATNSVVELNYGASGLTLGGVGYLTKTGLPTRDIYHGLTPLKWVDGNANANIDDGEIVIKTPYEIALDKLASTRKESKNIVDAINATSTFERAFILVLL